MMGHNRRRLLTALGGAAFVTLMVWFMTERMIEAEKAQVRLEMAATIPEPELVYVLVADTDLAIGRTITGDDLRWQAWPDTQLSPSYVTQSSGSETPFIGKVVRQPITAGEPMTLGRVINLEQGGLLSSILPADKRAMAVPIDETLGVASLLIPGDRVDLILTHMVSGEELSLDGGEPAAAAPIRVSETLLQDVKVLAVDQVLGRPPSEGESYAYKARTVTLELTPKQVEIVTVALSFGTISLSLRSVVRDDAPETVTNNPPVATKLTPTDTDVVATSRPRLASASETAPPATTIPQVPSFSLSSDASALLRGGVDGMIGGKAEGRIRVFRGGQNDE